MKLKVLKLRANTTRWLFNVTRRWHAASIDALANHYDKE